MAEGVLSGVAKGFTRKLADLIGQEIGLLWGVNDDLQKLKDTVSTIQAVLLDAEERQIESHAVRDWLRRLSDAVHEADDLVDDFSTEALRREVMKTRNQKSKRVRIFFSESNQLAYGLKLAHKIKSIREKLDAISADRIKFHLVERIVETQVVRYRMREQTHSFVLEEEVIGREGDKKAIIQLLLDSNVEDNVSVLPIVGMGGLGKTTLVQLVFNDEKIIKHFEKTMWVCISDNFVVKIIAEKILECITKEKPKNLEMNALVENLKKEIDGKRYLLVLDDVWDDNLEKWLSLKRLLMGGARGSRILVTTRIEGVAKITKTIQSFSLKGLDKHESWSLFKQMAFERGQEPNNSKKVEIGKEIVEKCVGIPLAIRTMGRLLCLKESEMEWVSFKKNELSKIPQDENDILPTLKLSYDHLPPHLKRCFAYCSLFPKDYEIDIQQLINLWIAQDFIQLYNDNQCLEDVGHDYFMNLVWRSFFQEVNKDEWGNVKKCKMHDLMHDLAIQVARKESTILNSNAGNIDEKTRHVSIGFVLSSLTQIPTPLFKASRIRTFLLPCQPKWGIPKSKLNESIFDAIVLSFRFLRMLDMHSTGIHIIPSSIGELKHLRYLDLSNNGGIKMLPKSITKLQNLQTLRLSWCTNLKALPRDINKLINLRYLEIDDCLSLTHMPRGLGQLTNLRALGKFMVRKDFISIFRRNGELKEIYGLNKLRGKLEIRNLGQGKSLALKSKDANLKEKEHIQALNLYWSHEHTNDTDVGYDEMCLEGFEPHPNLKTLYINRYSGMRFPSWLPSHSNLVQFSLRQCNKWHHLPQLDQFPSLKILSLDHLDALEYITLSEEGGGSEELSVSSFFPSLEILTIKFCYNLKGWRRKKDSVEEHHLPPLPSFPRLSYLFIQGCPKLTSMPLFPYLKEDLYFQNSSIKPLQQTMTMKMKSMESPTSTTTITSVPSTSSSSSSSSSSFSTIIAPLSNLKSLNIDNIKEVESLPKDWLGNLTCLNKLNIESCLELDLSNDGDGMQWQALRSLRSLTFKRLPKLTSLPVGLQHVTTLQELCIYYCYSLMAIQWIRNLTSLNRLTIGCCLKLDLSNDEDGMQWQALRSLRNLTFWDLPKLTSLPVGLQHVTTLQALWICHCDSLMAIPEWIRNLTSLQQLIIVGCPCLTSLPQGMLALTSLQNLKITNCPILSQRCERETGEDWPKISHIPNLEGDLSRLEQHSEPGHKTWSLMKTLGCCNRSTNQQPME